MIAAAKYLVWMFVLILASLFSTTRVCLIAIFEGIGWQKTRFMEHAEYSRVSYEQAVSAYHEVLFGLSSPTKAILVNSITLASLAIMIFALRAIRNLGFDRLGMKVFLNRFRAKVSCLILLLFGGSTTALAYVAAIAFQGAFQAASVKQIKWQDPSLLAFFPLNLVFVFGLLVAIQGVKLARMRTDRSQVRE